MNCCQCQGIEEMFDQKYAANELSRYRKKGPMKTTRMLLDALKGAGVEGMSLLDIGGGVGAIQHELLSAGAQRAENVDASAAFINAARSEAERREHSERVSYHHGNFVDLAADIPAADVVTLDRVICCYHDMPALVNQSAARARKLYGLVYPREVWWVKIGVAAENFFQWLRRNPFRAFVYPTEAVERVVSNAGLKRYLYRRTFIWQVVVYTR